MTHDPDADAARKVAARVGLPGIPVSMRTARDQPHGGVGTGHWRRRAAALQAAVSRARAEIVGVPPGAVRDQLTDIGEVLAARVRRYTATAEIGQALAPDDDTTNADGTAPGQPPHLRGAAREIDDRLATVAGHLADLAHRLAGVAATSAEVPAVDEEIALLRVAVDGA